jgi:putative ABC transport system permease protein
MSIIWRKVWRDLAHNKTRTLLVVLSTAVGVFALGLVFGLSGVMRARMTEDHRARIPAHIRFQGAGFDQATVDVIGREPGVAEAEGQTLASFRWKLPGETDWRDGALTARPDYEAQIMSRLDLLNGRWPTAAGRDLVVERQSARYFNLPLGSTIVVEFGRSERSLSVVGIVRAPDAFPPQFGGDATFYAAPETVAWLTGLDDFNSVNVRLDTYSRAGAEAVSRQIQDRLDRMGLPSGGYLIVDPNVHPVQELLDTLSFILGVLGTLSLGLGAFLIINTMNALVTQQVWQIGVMKVIGATSGRVVRVYLATALIYGLLACLVAVPLASLGAHLLGAFLLDLINVASGPLRVMPVVIVIQIVVGLAVPVLAALLPVMGGARITPHQAISSYGLGGRFGRGWLDRLLGRIRRLPRQLALSLRNTFRRKARVSLTLLTLMLGGVLFIVVMSVGSSLNNTLEVVIREFGLDVWVVFNRPYHTQRLIEIAESVPGVVQAEVWDQQAAELSLASGEEREVYVWGLPPDSALFNPRIVSGRRLLPDDGRAILLNNGIAAEEGIRVGEEIELTIGGRESSWTVVGLVFSISNDQRDNFVPFDALARETGNVGRGRIAMVLSDQHTPSGEQALIRRLRDTFNARGIEPSLFLSASELRQQSRTQFNLITTLMLVMAILAAAVGSIGLMGTMSINVVERSREIGVMRAIGATSLAIAGIFVSEGVLLGVLSWLLAVPVSYPGARAFSRIVGSTLMRAPLDFSYSLGGMALWLAIVVILSALASLWPARRATQVTVREVLAYE